MPHRAEERRRELGRERHRSPRAARFVLSASVRRPEQEGSMALTIRAILDEHRRGAAPADTVRAAYARIRAQDDPALFITLRPEAEAIAAAERLARTGATNKPLFG